MLNAFIFSDDQVNFLPKSAEEQENILEALNELGVEEPVVIHRLVHFFSPALKSWGFFCTGMP